MEAELGDPIQHTSRLLVKGLPEHVAFAVVDSKPGQHGRERRGRGRPRV